MKFHIIVNLKDVPEVKESSFSAGGGFGAIDAPKGDVVFADVYTNGPTLIFRSECRVQARWVKVNARDLCSLEVDDFVPTKGELPLPTWYEEISSRIVEVTGETQYGPDQRIRVVEERTEGVAVAKIRQQRPDEGKIGIPATIVRIRAIGPRALVDALALHRSILQAH